MAARANKILHDDQTRAKPYYVYFVREGNEIVYIGKGSGYRRRVQEKRFGLPTVIEKWFQTEESAFRAEAALIAMHKPRLNKAKGGYGGVCGRMDRDDRLIRDVGARAFAARVILAVKQISPNLVAGVDFERVNEVAYG